MSANYPYKVGDEPIPGYHVVKFLGRGGFGEVWRAEGPGGTNVSLKIITNLSSSQARKEFRALGIVKNIRHPNIVPIIGVWLKDGQGNVLDDAFANRADLVFHDGKPQSPQATLVAPQESVVTSNLASAELIMAMGLGDRNLHDRLQECLNNGLPGIPVDELLDYMEESARAIDYLNSATHDIGSGKVAVQHCDIKPHNILIVGSSVQVCDFGLARARGDLRVTAGASGSVAYAGPECLEGDGVPSATTDQYSLAISYYELRTGKLPYQDESFAAVMRAALTGTLDLSRATPAEIEVLRKATSRDPARRFGSCLEMVKSLRRAVEGGSPSPAAVVGKRASKASHSLVLVLFLGLAVTGSIIGYQKWGPGRKGAPPIPAGPSSNVAKSPDHTTSPDLPAQPEEPPHKTGPRSAHEATLAAESKMTQGLHDDAVALYGKALQFNSSHLPAYIGRAVAHHKTNDHDQAIADFAAAEKIAPQAVAEHPDYAQAHIRRGEQRLKQKLYDQAVDDFTAALKRNPREAFVVYVSRGMCFLEKRELSRALADLNQALELDNENPQAYFVRGQIHVANMDLDRGLQDFQTVFRLDSDNSQGWNARPEIAAAFLKRAAQYRQREEYESALKDCNEVLNHKPPFPAASLAGAYLERGTVYRDQTDLRAALADISSSIQLFQQSSLAYSRRGYIRLQMKLYDDAIADFSEAIKLEPNRLDSLNRAIAYAAKGSTDIAIQELTKLISEKSDDADCYYQRGLAYLDKQCYEKAVSDFRQVVRYDAKNFNAMAHLGFLLAGMENGTQETKDEALKWAKLAAESMDGNEGAQWDALAAALANAEMYDEAIKAIDKAIAEVQSANEEAAFRMRRELYKLRKPYRWPSTRNLCQ